MLFTVSSEDIMYEHMDDVLTVYFFFLGIIR